VISVGQTGVPFFPGRQQAAAGGGDAPVRLDWTGNCSAGRGEHSGEDFHVDGVRKILSGAGLSEDDLRCPPLAA